MEYCCDNKDIVNDNGANICRNCASIISYNMIDGWYSARGGWQIKSVHSRKKWFFDRVIKYVKIQCADTLAIDFMQVVNVMVDHRLLKGRNVSQYTYYILRLASRRGVKVEGKIIDMKTPHIKKIFDDRLFGVVYPILGWDINCRCGYYLSWKLKQN